MRQGVCCLLLLWLLSTGSAWGQAIDPYGGWKQLRGAATGWFHTQKLNGRWWLVDPQGQAFLSLGVNEVTLSRGSASPYRAAILRKYGSGFRWGPECVARLRGWGFTTVGAGSDRIVQNQQVPYVLSLDISSSLRLSEGQHFPDVFSPAFLRDTRTLAQRQCRALADDPWLIGYLSDTDLPWPAAEKAEESVFVQYLRLGDSAAGRTALLGFLEERYLQIEALNAAWHTEYQGLADIGRIPQVGAAIPREDEEDFLRLVAEQYFRVTHDAIREFDPNHLFLGCRLPASPPRVVLEVARTYADVLALRGGAEGPAAASLREAYRLAQRPILLEEVALRTESTTSRRAAEGLMEEERGRRYERWAAEVMALPMVVGCHWHRHCDQPGEEGAGGLVTTADEPHRAFVEAVTRVNREAYLRHTGEKPARKSTAVR